MKVNIFGSCYTREIFNYQSKYEVGCYVMQQSLFTLYAKPLEIRSDQARSLDNSNFMNRMVYFEFNKLGLKKVLENPSDYLIVDFADCRFDIYNFNNPKGVKIIYTHNVRKTFENIKDDPNFKNLDMEYCNVVENISDSEIREILKRFIGDILSVYDVKKIILNRVQMDDTYYVSGKKVTLTNNFHYGRRNFVTKIEDMFLELLPECKVLYTEEAPIININHRLGGPHPLHCEDIYCEYRMKLLDCLINDKDTSSVKEEYNRIYEKEIRKIELKEKDSAFNSHDPYKIQ